MVLDGALRKLDAPEDERDQFINHLADTCDEKLRQCFLTWKSNEDTKRRAREAEDKAAAKRPKSEPICTCSKGAQKCELHGTGKAATL